MKPWRKSTSLVVDLDRLECRSLFESSTENPVVYRLSGWAEGVEVRRVRDLIYIPEYGIPIANGFCPEELIGYAAHLDIRLGRDSPSGRRPADPLLDTRGMDRRNGDVVVLGNIFSYVFGHWLEELFKVITLESIGYSGSYVVPTNYSKNFYESLEMLNVQSDRILKVDKPTIFSTALVTTNLSLLRINKYRGVARRLRELMIDAIGDQYGDLERIWAIRGSAANGRRLINEDEVHDCARRHGFTLVDYAEKSFREQIALDRAAHVLAGPHGSAMLHSAFLSDRSEVIELLSPFYVNPSYPFCSIFSHRYNQIVGFNTSRYPYQYGDDIFVDVGQLENVLSSIN